MTYRRGAKFLVCRAAVVVMSGTPAVQAKSGQASVERMPDTHYKVSGLTAPAEILVDRWGVPHIYAGNMYDALFVQGFNAARDRLWQLDLWKRRGDGTLSEVFGSDFVEKDRAARLFFFRGDMHAERLAYASDTKRIVTAFVEGVSEYIRLTQHDETLLPLQFKLLKYTPALWEPDTVVRIRSHGLLRNVESEVKRAAFLDVGNWDDSLAMNTPGPSGDPNNPHYKDLFPMWSKDEAFALVYSRAAVVATEHRFLLELAK